MKKPDAKSRLKKFLETRDVQGGARCMACHLPQDVRAAIEDFYRLGKPASALADFAMDDGHAVTESSMQRHFRRRHHETAKRG